VRENARNLNTTLIGSTLIALTGFETANKYVVKNTMGQQIYFAAEGASASESRCHGHVTKCKNALLSIDSDCLTRQCCGSGRPFAMRIVDNSKQEVIHLERPLRCSSCWFPCCLQVLEVQAPPGQIVGYVKQT
jgi:hypothetical protein